MVKSQSGKSAYNNQLQQSSSNSLSEEKDVSNMAGEHTLAEPKLKVTPLHTPTPMSLPRVNLLHLRESKK